MEFTSILLRDAGIEQHSNLQHILFEAYSLAYILVDRTIQQGEKLAFFRGTDYHIHIGINTIHGPREKKILLFAFSLSTQGLLSREPITSSVIVRAPGIFSQGRQKAADVSPVRC